MKRIIILIPIFNDWDSLNKLLAEINNNIKDFKNFYFECLIVNDASTISRPKILKPPNIRSLRLMNMKINKATQDVMLLALDMSLKKRILIT